MKSPSPAQDEGEHLVVPPAFAGGWGPPASLGG